MLLPLLATFIGSLMPLKASLVTSKVLSLSLGRTTLRQGDSSYGTVSIDSLEGVQSLVVSLFFDKDAFDISSHSNLTTATLVDGNLGEGYVRYSYLFGNTADASLNLFRYYFTAKEDAEIKDYRFDVLVEEAYDEGLEPMDVTGTFGKISVEAAQIQKYTSLYSSGPGEVSYGDEISLSYSIGTCEIATGYFEWRYDDDELTYLDFEKGSFFEGKVVDIVASPGSVRLTFLSGEYGHSWQNSLGTLRFAPKENTVSNTPITLYARELYDLELDAIEASSITKDIVIVRNPTIVDYNADFTLQAQSCHSYDAQVGITIHLGAESHLGAGDFTVAFDPQQLRLSSYEKLLSADFFNVNDKKADEGILKFSIISMTDILIESDVLSISFDVLSMPENYHMDLSFSGSGLSDSLTNPIALRFLSSGIDFTPYQAENFAAEFLSTTGSICSSGSNNQEQLSAIWDDLKDRYLSLLPVEKNSITTATPDFIGDSSDILERTLGRYLFIVSKYGLENYMGINVNQSKSDAAVHDTVDSSPWLIVSIGTITTLAITLIAKKKRD